MSVHPLYENDPTEEVTRQCNFHSLVEADTYGNFGGGSGMKNANLGGPPKLPPRDAGYSSRIGANEYSNEDVEDQDLYLTPIDKIEEVVHRPSSNIPRRARQKKQQSYYDEDNYALPDATSNASSQSEDSAPGDINIFCKFWKRAYSKRGALTAALITSLICIVVVISVAISSSSKDKGKQN